ncbi:glycoside hydrolase family 127 protein [Mobilitalea sibirica]|uniref:Glycoside hydrolase family 127 protein n=1 Tax=Mobilitalea sibirica TaxID=1462919 RepID=A0A8J7KWV0_9FIRM|nr:beta-L-arabinofuranosidase domain-containing protein [Mobilitalea sibirica]MBH1940932.1 glycoside hydrolase family 127 protein [Mobilitalea sibirica]
MNQIENSRPLSLKNVKIIDYFWKKELELIRNEVIPYQWKALNDQIEGANPSFCMHNFKVAGKILGKKSEKGKDYIANTYPTDVFVPMPEDMDHLEDRFYGFVFQDSDFYKWIEAVGYSLIQYPDPQLEQLADQAIDIVCAAQQPDGYLDTYYIINNPEHIFTDLCSYHELYCFGHLAEGAVAYYQATGKDKLLKAAQRYADYITSRIGPEEGKLKGYPGHEIAEMALVRLYEQTSEDKYLKLSKYFIDERGKRPYYFDIEKKKEMTEGDTSLRYHYHQAHLPVREQEEAVGHAVRAVYLYSGMADIARITKDEILYDACEKLWNNIVDKKLYITGGIGGTHIGEAFSFNYDLPNDTAYAETCASIGLMFFARRMLEIKPDSKYANVMERALYNGILSGMSLDGKSFFYVNPLEVLPEACHKDERKSHVKPVRQKWFGCACCPPNIARLLCSIGSYAYTETNDTLFVHLYMGSQITKIFESSEFNINIYSSFPWNGKVSVEVKTKSDAYFTIALRIPDWCEDYKLIGAQKAEKYVKDGYLYIKKCWVDGELIEIEFPMKVKFLEANPHVRENIGKVAVMRGPLVYCMEEADNGKDLHLLELSDEPKTEVHFVEKMGEDIAVITTAGRRRIISDDNLNLLYNEYKKPIYDNITIQWIPYYTWANRGEGEMRVWIQT